MPVRVDGDAKEGLLKLVDDAVAAGWAHTRVCELLGVADVRVHRWRARLRIHGTLVDRAPGGNPVHRLLAWEEQTILKLIEQWGPPTGRTASWPTAAAMSARCSSRRPRCCASAKNTRSACPASRLGRRGPHRRCPRSPGNETASGSTDASHLQRARRVAYAIVDVVTRYWIGYLLTAEMTSTQVQVLFHQALEDQGLLDGATGELLGGDGRPLDRDDDGPPILVAWSDNGPEMTSTDTREFMALMAIAQHHGRPGTPTDQAHVESFYSHLKAHTGAEVVPDVDGAVHPYVVQPAQQVRRLLCHVGSNVAPTGRDVEVRPSWRISGQTRRSSRPTRWTRRSGSSMCDKQNRPPAPCGARRRVVG